MSENEYRDKVITNRLGLSSHLQEICLMSPFDKKERRINIKNAKPDKNVRKWLAVTENVRRYWSLQQPKREQNSSSWIGTGPSN